MSVEDEVLPDGTLLINAEDSGNKSTLPFVDVRHDDWFYQAINAVVSGWEIMVGTSDTTFSPNEPITRGILATILYRIEEVHVGNSTSFSTRHSFDDVPSDAYYDEAISCAVENGIVTGYSDTIFAPNDSVTREELVTMLYRYFENLHPDIFWQDTGAIASSFLDFDLVSEYARESMENAVMHGVLTGKTQTTLEPQGTSTRAEAAAIIYRFLNYTERDWDI